MRHNKEFCYSYCIALLLLIFISGCNLNNDAHKFLRVELVKTEIKNYELKEAPNEAPIIRFEVIIKNNLDTTALFLYSEERIELVYEDSTILNGLSLMPNFHIILPNQIDTLNIVKKMLGVNIEEQRNALEKGELQFSIKEEINLDSICLAILKNDFSKRFKQEVNNYDYLIVKNIKFMKSKDYQFTIE